MSAAPVRTGEKTKVDLHLSKSWCCALLAACVSKSVDCTSIILGVTKEQKMTLATDQYSSEFSIASIGLVRQPA